MKNTKITSKTTKMSSQILVVPLVTVLLSIAIIQILPEALAHVDCSQDDNHCYSIAHKDVDNRGGSSTDNLNGGNYVESNSAITNPLWIRFLTGLNGDKEWLEVGWQKGSPMSPCSSTTAKYYWYEGIGSTHNGGCLSTISGSTANYEITDSDGNDWWTLKINGLTVANIFNDENALYMDVGGESTNENNSLDNGRSKNLVIIYPDGTPYSWGSTGVSLPTPDAHYTSGWNTAYTDFHYEGP